MAPNKLPSGRLGVLVYYGPLNAWTKGYKTVEVKLKYKIWSWFQYEVSVIRSIEAGILMIDIMAKYLKISIILAVVALLSLIM